MTTTQKKTSTRRVRLKDIAKQSDLSVATVSMALADHPNVSDQTKRLVRRISREMGYAGSAPATTTERQPDRMRLGFMTVGSNVADPSYAVILHELQKQTDRRGIRLELSGTRTRDPEQALSQAMAFADGLSGLLLIGYVEQEMLLSLSEADRPCVLIGSMLEEKAQQNAPGVFTVAPNLIDMARCATRYLFEQGHTRVAYLCETIPPGLADSRLMTGYQQAHLETCRPVDSQLIHVSGVSGSGTGPAVDAFGQLADPPTGFVLPTPSFGASLAQVMQSRGLSLDRKACCVIGQPELAQSYGVEDMPLVSYDTEALASLSIDLMSRLVSGTAEASHDILLPWSARVG